MPSWMEVITRTTLSSGNSGVRAESQMPVLVSPRDAESLAMETQGLQDEYLCSGEKTGQLDIPKYWGGRKEQYLQKLTLA